MKKGKRYWWTYGKRYLWFVGTVCDYYTFEDASGERFTMSESATWDLEEA